MNRIGAMLFKEQDFCLTDNLPGTLTSFGFMIFTQEIISTYVDPSRKIFTSKVSFRCRCQCAS